MPLMPASTQRHHFEPAWRGDGPAGIDKVARDRVGRDKIRAVDINLQWAWTNPRDHSQGGVAYAMHWGKPGRLNNYRYILDGARIRKMTRAELVRPISKWPAAQVARWRRSKVAASARPWTYGDLVRRAVTKGVIIIGELKALAFRTAVAANHLVQAALNAGHPPWFMALFGSMKGCAQKAAAIIAAGGQFAVIFGRFGRAQWPRFKRSRLSWAVQPTRVW